MSGKKAKALRKAKTIEKNKPDLASMPRTLERPAPSLKLDLACGQNCRDGFEGVDLPGVGVHIDEKIAKLEANVARTEDEGKQLAHLRKVRPLVKHEINLMRFPWPWADSSVAELHCSHFIEHLPMIYVDSNGLELPCGTPGAKDLFFKFFDECYRILVPGGSMEIYVPCGRNNRAFQDPTHRRFFVEASFFYLLKKFRDINGLDHYIAECDFEGSVNPIVVDEAMALKSDDVRNAAFAKEWNVIHDFNVKLKSLKPV